MELHGRMGRLLSDIGLLVGEARLTLPMNSGRGRSVRGWPEVVSQVYAAIKCSNTTAQSIFFCYSSSLKISKLIFALLLVTWFQKDQF